MAVPETERIDGNGPCRTQPADMSDLLLPAIPGYTPAAYYGTVMIPVGRQCSTSASVSSNFPINIAGTVTTIAQYMFMGKRAASDNGDPIDPANDHALGNVVYVHELLRRKPRFRIPPSPH